MFNLKNLRLYRLSRDVKFDTDSLQEKLSAMVFTPCGSRDQTKTGWIPPLGNHAELLFHACNGHILLARRREDKLLPAEIIRKELAAKVDKLESEQGRTLKKIEKDSLKDEVLHTLLPRAFTRQSDLWIWIDTTSSLIAVDSASAKKAEDALALLRKTLGSLPVVPLTMETPIELTLTGWLKLGKAPFTFDLGESAVLQAVLENGGKVNSDIIWDPGDMLVYLATTGTWCRLLGQQVVAGEPVPLKIDADIILNVGSGLQIVTSGTTAVDVVRLDTDNNLVLGADALPGICLKTAEPTSLFVLVPDGNGGYTKSRIYSEVFPPPEIEPPVTSVNSKTGDVELTAADVSALSSGGGVLTGDLSGTDASFTGFVSAPDILTSRINTGGAVLEFGTGTGTASDYYWDIHTIYPETDYDYRFHFRSDVNTIELLSSNAWANIVVGNLEAIGLTAIHSNYTVFVNGTAVGLDGSGFTAYYNSSGVNICNAGYYMGGWDIHFYDDTGLWVSNPVHVDRNGTVTINSQLNVSTVYESGQRVYSPNNPPPATDLSGYETIADANARFVQGIQLGAQGSMQGESNKTYLTPEGNVFTGLKWYSSNYGVSVIYYKPIQEDVGGIWMTIYG